MSNAIAAPAPAIGALHKVHLALSASKNEETGLMEAELKSRPAAIAVLDRAGADFARVLDLVGRNAVFAEGARFLDILFLPLQNSLRVQTVEIIREGEDLVVAFENGWRFRLDTSTGDDDGRVATDTDRMSPMGWSSLKPWSFKSYSESLTASGCRHWILPETVSAELAVDASITNLCALATGIEYGLQAEVTAWFVACDELQRAREESLVLEGKLDGMLEQLALRVPATASPADFDHLPVEKAAGVMALFSGLTGPEIMEKLATHPDFAANTNNQKVGEPTAA